MGTYYAYYCPSRREYFDGGGDFGKSDPTRDPSRDYAVHDRLNDDWNPKRPTCQLTQHVLYELMGCFGPWHGHGVMIANLDDCPWSGDPDWKNVCDVHRLFLREKIAEYDEQQRRFKDLRLFVWGKDELAYDAGHPAFALAYDAEQARELIVEKGKPVISAHDLAEAPREFGQPVGFAPEPVEWNEDG